MYQLRTATGILSLDRNPPQAVGLAVGGNGSGVRYYAAL